MDTENKIRNISADMVTPLDCLTDVNKKLNDIKEIYIVSVSHDGRSTVWASGKMNNLAFAALTLQVHAMDQLRDA